MAASNSSRLLQSTWWEVELSESSPKNRTCPFGSYMVPGVRLQGSPEALMHELVSTDWRWGFSMAPTTWNWPSCFLVTTATGPLPEQALLGRVGFWNKTWLPLPGSCHGNSGGRISVRPNHRITLFKDMGLSLNFPTFRNIVNPWSIYKAFVRLIWNSVENLLYDLLTPAIPLLAAF